MFKYALLLTLIFAQNTYGSEPKTLAQERIDENASIDKIITDLANIDSATPINQNMTRALLSKYALNGKIKSLKANYTGSVFDSEKRKIYFLERAVLSEDINTLCFALECLNLNPLSLGGIFRIAAAWKDSPAGVELLLKKGVKPLLIGTPSNEGALMCALKRGCPESVYAIAKAGREQEQLALKNKLSSQPSFLEGFPLKKDALIMGLFDIRFAWIQGVARNSKFRTQCLVVDRTAELARRAQAREKRIRVEEVKE